MMVNQYPDADCTSTNAVLGVPAYLGDPVDRRVIGLLRMAQSLFGDWPRARDGMGENHELAEISGEMREANIAPAQAGSFADPCRRIGGTDQSHYR